MSPKNSKVCPACRRPAQNRPLPPDGFWQVQVLQRIGMYPYRCEACGARFYRKVSVGEGLGEGRYKRPPRRPGPGGRAGAGAEPSSRNWASTTSDRIPKVVAPPEATGESLTHEDFVDLINHISRSEERKGLEKPEKKDEDA